MTDVVIEPVAQGLLAPLAQFSAPSMDPEVLFPAAVRALLGRGSGRHTNDKPTNHFYVGSTSASRLTTHYGMVMI